MDIALTENGDYRTLSASQVNKFYSCSRLWAYEYVADIKPPPTYPMKKGRFIHAVIEEFNETLGPLPEEGEHGLRSLLKSQIRQVARRLWKQGLPGEFEDEMRDNHEEILDQMFNYVETLVKRFDDIQRRTDLSASQAWKRASPSANELSVLITDEEGNWLFRGDIDSVFEKHPLWFDRTAVIDYKTGKSPFDADEPLSIDYSRQLDIYTWLYYQAFGSVPEVAGVQFLAEPPESPTAFMYKEVDPGTVESVHLMLNRIRDLLVSEDVEDYPRNTQYKWCEFHKRDGTVIKCDHWEYCLGDREMPDPTNRPFDGPEREPVEVVLSNPLEEQLILTEHAAAVFEDEPMIEEEP